MATDQTVATQLRNLGLPWAIANQLADPAGDTINGAAVANAAALTAPASMGASYNATNVNALRADVLALQTKLNALLTSLRAAGVIAE